MAEAAIEERQLLKSLRWYDGFVIALCNPGFLIGFVGFSFGTLGAWGAMALWGISAGVGLLQNWIYSETAAMFPEQSGGISLYAHEGWRRYFSLVGPVATFGYWIGWSVVLSIFGKIVGDIVMSKWFPGSAADIYFTIGKNHLGPAHMIAIALIAAVWAFNVFGVKPSLWLGYITGGLLMIPLFVLLVVPFIRGDWHSSTLHWTVGGPWGGLEDRLRLVVPERLVGLWDRGGGELRPRVPRHETRHRARVAVGGDLLAARLHLPADDDRRLDRRRRAEQGGCGRPVLRAAVRPPRRERALGRDARVRARQSRALDELLDGRRRASPVRDLESRHDDQGARRPEPLPRARPAMTVDLIVNVCLVLFVSSNLAILYLSNIGYVFAHVAALSGFLLLRKYPARLASADQGRADSVADRRPARRGEHGVPGRRRRGARS